MADKRKPTKLKTRFMTMADVAEMEKALREWADFLGQDSTQKTPDGPTSGRCPTWCPLRRLRRKRR